MTPDELELKRLGEAATPGPWTREKPSHDESGFSNGVMIAVTYGRQPIYAFPPSGQYPSADANFIAAANPQAVRSILDHVEELEHVLAEQAGEVLGGRKGHALVSLANLENAASLYRRHDNDVPEWLYAAMKEAESAN